VTVDVRGATAVVAGALANKVGNGGEAWVRPTWTIGLDRLGFDAWLVEELAPGGDATSVESAVRWFREVAGWFGLGERCALVAGDRTLVGPPIGELRDVMEQAAVLFDISGHLHRSDLGTPRAVRVYVDVDPGFTQVWSAQGLLDLGGHDHHVTVGTAIGSPACPLPSCGIDWITTLPPVLMDRWTVVDLPDGPPRATTVTSWRPPHGPISWDGVHYGVKAHEFRNHLEVAELAEPFTIELALAIDEGDAADRRRLACAGFGVADPSLVASTPWDFADYVAGSWAEWSVAQGAYVHGRTGWVSDRSAHYLAAGRPVVAQDTGSSLPLSEGFRTFVDPAGAASSLAAVLTDPDAASAAARALAQERFASDLVLSVLCERVGVLP
jgi:hypothetical protein